MCGDGVPSRQAGRWRVPNGTTVRPATQQGGGGLFERLMTRQPKACREDPRSAAQTHGNPACAARRPEQGRPSTGSPQRRPRRPCPSAAARHGARPCWLEATEQELCGARCARKSGCSRNCVERAGRACLRRAVPRFNDNCRKRTGQSSAQRSDQGSQRSANAHAGKRQRTAGSGGQAAAPGRSLSLVRSAAHFLDVPVCLPTPTRLPGSSCPACRAARPRRRP